MQPVNCKIGQELAGHMIAGMVDRFLEYGYLSQIVKHSKEYTPLFTSEGEEVNAHAMPTSFVLYRDKVDADNPGVWMITIHLDIHFNVTDVDVQSEWATIDVAVDLHRVLADIMNRIDSFGKPKNQIKQATDCIQL